MARVLKELLANDHPLFLMNVARLEQATGNTGVDIRLVGDIAEKANRIMRELGLDPANTTDHELYLALGALVRRDESKARQLFTGTTYVLVNLGTGPISLNIFDIIENDHHHLPYDKRTVAHAQRGLRGEIVRRYAELERAHKDTVHDVAREVGMLLEDDEQYPAIEINKTEENDMGKPYILAIGDIFTDAFITLGDETAKIIKEGDTEWLAVPFGRKPPYEKVDIVKSVGPSPNVAVSMARLGGNAGLMAWIGGDATGEEAVEYLKSENVSTEPMIVEDDKATSYWYVLCYKADRTMLVKSEKYRYEWKDPATKPEWIYLAYLGEDSWPLHEGLLDYLERNPDINFVLQPGTFQFKWGAEKMAGLYKRSKIVLMNREEAMDVTGRGYDSIKDLADGLHELGAEIVVITDGPNGSYASDGTKVLTIPNYPDPAPPLERTGAGDAFSSTFVAAIAAGESLETALLWSPINSMNVVQHVGAQKGLLTKAELEKHLENAPEWYKVKEVE